MVLSLEEVCTYHTERALGVWLPEGRAMAERESHSIINGYFWKDALRSFVFTDLQKSGKYGTTCALALTRFS